MIFRDAGAVFQPQNYTSVEYLVLFLKYQVGLNETAEIVSVSYFPIVFGITSVTPHLHSPLSLFVLSSYIIFKTTPSAFFSEHSQDKAVGKWLFNFCTDSRKQAENLYLYSRKYRTNAAYNPFMP